LAFKCIPEGAIAPIVRNYSISGAAGTGTYRVSVKRTGGIGSRYFNYQVQQGDLLQVSAPRGSFTLAESDGPVVLMSAGIGVTPVLSMLHALRKTDSAAREVWWCYGARNRKEHPFAAEAQNVIRGIPHSHSFVAYSKPEATDVLGSDYDAVGHLSLASLQNLGLPQNADFYLCGPPAFLDELPTALKSWGVSESRIHMETFGAESSLTPGIASTSSRPPHPPAENVGAGPNISFARSGLTVPWDSRFGSLLEFAEACDVPVRWSCRVGVCHTCESGMIDGRVQYAPDPLDRPSPGNVLICCSTPLSEIQLDL
jgi:ferredoxin-NADP reductase